MGAHPALASPLPTVPRATRPAASETSPQARWCHRLSHRRLASARRPRWSGFRSSQPGYAPLRVVARHALRQARGPARHRRLGVGPSAAGRILNAAAEGHGFRDHYITLDYDGWKYHELLEGESDRYYDHKWPYSWIDLLYWPFHYSQVKGLNLYYNELPGESQTHCLVGRIEALSEGTGPLQSPTLQVGDQRLTIPVAVLPEEYVEIGWDGTCRHFERNGGLLAEPVLEGKLELPEGEAPVTFSCVGGEGRSAHAELTICTKGAPLDNAPPASANVPEPAGLEDPLHLVAAQHQGVRVLEGQYERVGRAPARSIPALDGTANVWTVTNEQPTPVVAALVVRYDDVPAAPVDNGNAVSSTACRLVAVRREP